MTMLMGIEGKTPNQSEPIIHSRFMESFFFFTGINKKYAFFGAIFFRRCSLQHRSSTHFGYIILIFELLEIKKNEVNSWFEHFFSCAIRCAEIPDDSYRYCCTQSCSKRFIINVIGGVISKMLIVRRILEATIAKVRYSENGYASAAAAVVVVTCEL